MHWDEGGLDLPPVVVAAELPVTTTSDAVAADYSLLGLAQEEHLLALFRPQLADLGVLTTAELEAQPHGARARVAGRIEIVQRPPPAKGIAFVSIEDEHGLANLLLFPDAYDRNRRALRASPVIIAEGEVQRERGALHLITERIVPVEIDGDVASIAPDDVPGPAKEYA
jgi:error-prone DNA polymerase